MGEYEWSGIRTLEHCGLISMLKVKPRQQDGKCDGFAFSETNDEPCEACKRCKLKFIRME